MLIVRLTELCRDFQKCLYPSFNILSHGNRYKINILTHKWSIFRQECFSTGTVCQLHFHLMDWKQIAHGFSHLSYIFFLNHEQIHVLDGWMYVFPQYGWFDINAGMNNCSIIFYWLICSKINILSLIYFKILFNSTHGLYKTFGEKKNALNVHVIYGKRIKFRVHATYCLLVVSWDKILIVTQTL